MKKRQRRRKNIMKNLGRGEQEEWREKYIERRRKWRRRKQR